MIIEVTVCCNSDHLDPLAQSFAFSIQLCLMYIISIVISDIIMNTQIIMLTFCSA